MFSKHDTPLTTDLFWFHRFIGRGFPENTMCVDPAFMGECHFTYDRLVHRQRNTGKFRDQGREMIDLASHDRGPVIIEYLQRHNEFLKRGITCPLSKPVHRYMGAAGTGLKGCKCIREGKPEIVMAMDG